MRVLMAFMAGGLFGAGLLVSGMTNTRKVQGWLDFFGDWDPTLAFVLGGAIIPMAIAWVIASKRSKSLLGTDIPTPADPRISADLAIGSIMFGAGWGLSGLCPGPAMASLSFGGREGVVFFFSMVIAMWLLPRLRSRISPRKQAVNT